MKNVITGILAILIACCSIQCQETKSSEVGNKTAAAKGQHKAEASTLSGNNASLVSKEIKVMGDVENTLTLTVDSLKNMPVVSLQNLPIVCMKGTVNEMVATKGVLLKDILLKAKIAQANHKDRNFYIVARATDDYKATFSWAEIFNNPAGDQVYVLFEENGKPLTEKGEMILVSMTDTKTGPRHVTWLKSIEVNRVK